MGRYRGPRLPDGHPELNDYLFWIACCHEAGHSVAAYHLKFPRGAIRVARPAGGRIELAHMERVHDAVEIAIDYIQGLGEIVTKLLLAECIVSEMGRAINISMNGIPNAEANGYASDDRDFLLECYELSGFGQDVVDWAEREKVAECGRLIRNRGFQLAVEAVADALVANDGHLSEHQVTEAIERAVGTGLRNPAPEPPHDNIELAAYYLSLKPGNTRDDLQNWLTAEKGMRFGIASRAS